MNSGQTRTSPTLNEFMTGGNQAAQAVIQAHRQGMPLPAFDPAFLGPVMGLAAAPDEIQARTARLIIVSWRLETEAALTAIISELAQAPEQVLQGAGEWLFSPEAEEELELLAQLVGQADSLLALMEKRPCEWWQEGLAQVISLAGEKPLLRLLETAREQAWARQVVAALPQGLTLPGGASPGPWLLHNRMGGERLQKARSLAEAGEWLSLASMGKDALEAIWHEQGPKAGAEKAPAIFWPAGADALALLEQICLVTVREGALAYGLARDISRNQGRVVILMGNATLGAPPLWAAPGPWSQAPGLAPAQPLPGPAEEMQDLAKLRAIRLAGPGLLKSLWALATALRTGGQGQEHLTALFQEASAWLEPQEIEALLQGNLHLAPGNLPLQPALDQARSALETARQMQRQGVDALALIWGLAQAGAGMLARGEISSLVLPWADKFAASTSKDGDHIYLARLNHLLASSPAKPLMLMIDETQHPASASLAQILKAVARLKPELRIKGLGVFGEQDEPGKLRAELLQAAQDADLVAFRPLPSRPAPGLIEYLCGRGRDAPLNAASRDGATCLLSGTTLSVLSGEGRGLGQDETIPFLLTKQGLAPLGAWFRTRIRNLAQVEEPGRDQEFWQRYQRACGLL